ncbi:MAG: ABC transporter ATP-binding protein [Chloroflexota bacterium]
MTNALELNNLGVTFGGIRAVHDVSLVIKKGERRAILGPNGAGKSSLFNLVAGEYQATSGSVKMFGEDVTQRPIHLRSRMGLGRTYQTSALFPSLTVLDHLYLAVRGCYAGRMSFARITRQDQHRQTAIGLAEKVGLDGMLSRTVADISHGEQRQLEVGLSLAGDPRLILLDEPAAGLSQGERSRLVSLLASLDQDLTILIIEHDMDVAMEVADIITVMHDGTIIASGTPAEIAQNEEIHALYLGKHHE